MYLQTHRPSPEKAAKDLRWVLASPSLIESELAVDDDLLGADLVRYRGVLARFAHARSPLDDAIRKLPRNKLGDYFEALVATWLEAIGPVKILARNLQVNAPSGSVGEFDLVFSRDREVFHWELAVKFYLGHPGPDGQAWWYGPNPADRFDTKWTKMRDKQLHLSKQREGRAALERLGIRTSVHPQALVRGFLYEPVVDRFRVALPDDANPEGLRGVWVHAADRAALETTFPKLRWRVLPRLFWLSPSSTEDKLHEFSAGDLPPSNVPVHVAGVDSAGQEVLRAFIVPDTWPDGG